MRRRIVLRTAAAVVAGGLTAAWAPGVEVSAEARWWTGLAGVLQTAPTAGGPFRQSAAIGDWVAEQAKAHGGDGRVIAGLVVFVGTPEWMYARGGTTFGDTFIAPVETWAGLRGANGRYGQDALIAHERYHRDHQWRRYGAAFSGLYLAEEATARVDGRVNAFEWAADVYGGRTGYVPDDGSGGSRQPRPVGEVTGREHVVSTPDQKAR